MNTNKVAEAKYENAPTWIFWDISFMPVPKGHLSKAGEIAQKLKSALNKLNYRGPVSIIAYGNMNHVPTSIKKALSSAGIALNHVSGGSRETISHFEDDLLFLLMENTPAPANLMLIARHPALMDSLGEMQSEGYNILLATHLNADDSFLSCATTAWLWVGLWDEPEPEPEPAPASLPEPEPEPAPASLP
ncbi:unnamed protein product [Thlaspi arvense]|uniref:NYN domain-containing protein n=1 Tax=Thlaspi arvense TaxID=13288 RepID=A0AAU9R668_THLAR|nr:unnamed protein product [Thlaspi arvense]